MSKTFRFGLVALPLFMSLFSDSMMAQGTQPPAAQPAQQPPAQPASPPLPPAQQPEPPQGAGVPSTMTVAPATPPPPKEPYVLSDGGFYIEPLYWRPSGEPRLRGGLTALNIGDLQYLGKLKPGLGFEIGVPAGRSNTIRVTAFRVQGNSNFTLGKDAIVFGEQYYAGYYLTASYKMQSIKASWDYLSYTSRKYKNPIHIKTLYEAQYVTTNFVTAPPFVAGTVDTSGNNNIATGSKHIILPTLGMALSSDFGKYFRWDVRASGFGFPGRGDIADVEALVAARISKVEVVIGERFYHYKTSPRSDMYSSQTMQGVYGGLRFVFSGLNK
jgi:hypothetical protein